MGQKRTHAVQQFLFDYFIRAGKKLWQNDKAESLGRLQVDHRLVFVGAVSLYEVAPSGL
jgi:hypothetical protein